MLLMTSLLKALVTSIKRKHFRYTGAHSKGAKLELCEQKLNPLIRRDMICIPIAAIVLTTLKIIPKGVLQNWIVHDSAAS